MVNLVFIDSTGTPYFIKDNDSTTIYLYESVTPVVGATSYIANKFNNGQPLPYIDTFVNSVEAASRVGSGLLDNTFYYYTAFDKPLNTNVAQADFAIIDSAQTTQSSDISTKDRQFGTLLYNLWPSLFRELDFAGDLQDLMSVFGFQLNQLHSLVDTYNLQNSQTVFYTALVPLSEQSGLPSIGSVIGIDTLRRVADEMITCWEMKGSKEGIARFIRVITTWDITNGTGDYSTSIVDSLASTNYLTFWTPVPLHQNIRLTETDPTVVPGGRFIKLFPGIIIPGFFTVREFDIQISDVALYVGSSVAFSIVNNTTVMTDNFANFGANDSLIGNFLLPNQQEFNDIFKIIANTATTITVEGIMNNRNAGGSYAVLSPLNANRFVILNSLLPGYIPVKTSAIITFV